jgi:GntR family transcriptional repressor for pyruvate dehydrogenase complex
MVFLPSVTLDDTTPGDIRPVIEASSGAKGTSRKGRHRTEQVTEALKRYILVNQLAPGSRLPTERQLATALLVGRNLVREALNSLVALGIIEKRHGSGIYVREFDPERLAEQISYGLREDTAYWRYLYEARVEIEAMIAPLAAQRISRTQLARLESLVEAMRRQSEHGEGVEDNDYAFHRILAASSANPVLERLASALLVEYFRHTASLRLDLALAGDPRTAQNHEPLLAALAARDPSASLEAMRFHFRMTPGLMETMTDRRAQSGRARVQNEKQEEQWEDTGSR